MCHTYIGVDGDMERVGERRFQGGASQGQDPRAVH